MTSIPPLITSGCMKKPFVLLIISGAACFVAFTVPAWSDLLLLSVPCALASVWLIWRAWRATGSIWRLPGAPAPNWVILDGSNIMHWKDGVPNIEPVREVLAILREQGFTAGVMFDANAGYKLNDKYQHDYAFSKMLKLPENRIMVVPKGTPADPYILMAARDFGARIVTNDQFRDWAEDYPEVNKPGFLIKGRYTLGKLDLTLS